jgi:3-methyl-2-oxobutanoate hydroxymethyltransferase
MEETRGKLTVPTLKARKAAGEKVAMISVPDYPMAVWAERAGADMVVVGDSLAMVTYGHANTLPLTVGQMIAHTQAVRRGAPNTFCLTSMPYGSYATPEIGIANALRLMKEGGADAVKMQGGKEKAAIIRAIADAGIPVMSHIGMCPHFMHHYGGFKLQGRTATEAAALVEDGIAVEQAGAIGFEIEAVPASVAQIIDAHVSIFTFGIGAGPACCGQILLGADLMGAFDAFKPKFAKRYAEVVTAAVGAFVAYTDDVRSGRFPDDDHSYHMKPEEEALIASELKSRGIA